MKTKLIEKFLFLGKRNFILHRLPRFFVFLFFCFQPVFQSYAENIPSDPASAIYKVGWLNLIDTVDKSRNRNVPIYISYPAVEEGENSKPDTTGAPYPLIILSHGFGADSHAYNYLAEHLAANGYVVFAPEHIGSNTTDMIAKIKKLVSEYGLEKLFTNLLPTVKEIINADEFFDRPKDVSFLIDEAGRLTINHYQTGMSDLPSTNNILQGMIDTSKIGMTGHSFGGYTTLAASGASIDIPLLNKDCPKNPSMIEITTAPTDIFQCQPRFSKYVTDANKVVNLGDSRILASIPMAPVSSKIFGEEGVKGIKIPIMIMGGDGDTITPYQKEQADTFEKIESSPKYLLTLKGGTHLSFNDDIDDIVNRYELPPDLEKFKTSWKSFSAFANMPTLNLNAGHYYVKTMAVAFFNRYVKGDVRYDKFLTDEYIKELAKGSGEISIESVKP